MNYQISEQTKQKLEQLTAQTSVQRALEFAEADQETILEKQIELTLIPAPTGAEGQKAKRLLEMFQEEGVEDCHIDEYGNCVGILRGTGDGVTTLLEAHMDTVFPMDTKLEIVREDGYIKCPGIVDDTRGCAAVLSAVRAIRAAGIQPKGDIHVVGTVQEEGMGALKGMQYYCQHHPELQASVSVDGDGFEEIVCQATGIQTYEITFHGIGGHAWAAFGQVANPLHAAARFMAKLADFEVPSESFTTFAATGSHAGNMAAVHAIVPEASVVLNFRSNDQKDLMDLKERIFAAVEEACQEETARWGKDKITWTSRHICDVNAGAQDIHEPIVEAAYAVSQYLGCAEPGIAKGGSTNCSRALEAGLPAICLGAGRDYDSKCHTLQEQFKPEGAYKGAQIAMLMALLCAGTEEVESVIR